jgi:hypothetical protein
VGPAVALGLELAGRGAGGHHLGAQRYQQAAGFGGQFRGKVVV